MKKHIIVLLSFLFLTINSQAQNIEVISPNGGDYFTLGETYFISWTDNIDENVRIDLWKSGTYNEGGTQIPITTSTLSDGNFTWTVPSDLEVGGDYKIRIKSIIDPTNDNLYDYSDQNFFVIQANLIDVTSPEADAVWYIGEIYEITWMSSFSESVSINLYDEGGVKNITGATNNDGSYLWTIPMMENDISIPRQIKIHKRENELIYGKSEYGFRIKLPEVHVDYPNGYQRFLLGHTYEIKWTDYIDENVRIDLWKAGTWSEGGTQIPIITSTESDGSYMWTIPTEIEEGNDYKIRIKSVINPTNDELNDYSNYNFTIVSATDISDNKYVSETISLPYENVHQINFSEDVDWFYANFENNVTYRIYNSSAENIDTKITIFEVAWEEDPPLVFKSTLAQDDNSGENNQPFIEYKHELTGKYHAYLKVELAENVTPTIGDYTLHIFELCDKINLKTFLQGAFNSETNLLESGLGDNIPKTSPYGDGRSVEEIPENVIDWVMVELRNKDDKEIFETSISAFLLKNGNIVDLDGLSVLQLNAPADSYYIVIKHRNHLPIMSKEPIDMTGTN